MEFLVTLLDTIHSAALIGVRVSIVVGVIALACTLIYRKKSGIIKDLWSAGFGWFLVVTLGITVIYCGTLLYITAVTGDASTAAAGGGRFGDSGQFGDSFGALTAFLNALALAALVATVVLQNRELRQNRKAERRKENFQQRQINQQRAAAVNFAIFTLSRMYNEQLDYQKQVLDKIRSHPLRWYALRPSSLRVLSAPKFEYEKLQFLFSSKDADAVATVALEESRFVNLLDLVNRRNEMHMNEVQPILQRAGYQHGSTVEIGELERILGPLITNSLKNYTDMIFEFVDAGLLSTHAASKVLRAATIPMVGGETIIRFEPKKIQAEGANSRNP